MKLPAAMRSIARAIRYGPDRWLHPLRRAGALRVLSRAPRPRAVLFLCHGNICRSPYAAAVFERAIFSSIGAPIAVHSAGFIGPNRPMPREGLQVAALRGLDLGSHRSALIDQARLADAALIVVMDAHQRRALHERFSCRGKRVIILSDLDSLPIDRRAIPDPFDKPVAVFADAYDRIDRCVNALAATVARSG